QKAESKFVITGDGAARTTAFQKCLIKYDLKWPGLETKAVATGAACPSMGASLLCAACGGMPSGAYGTVQMFGNAEPSPTAGSMAQASLYSAEIIRCTLSACWSRTQPTVSAIVIAPRTHGVLMSPGVTPSHLRAI